MLWNVSFFIELVVDFIGDLILGDRPGRYAYGAALARQKARAQRNFRRQRTPRSAHLRSSIRLISGSQSRVHSVWMPGSVEVRRAELVFDGLFSIPVVDGAHDIRWFSGGDEPVNVSPRSVIRTVQTPTGVIEWALPPEYYDWAERTLRGEAHPDKIA